MRKLLLFSGTAILLIALVLLICLRRSATTPQVLIQQPDRPTPVISQWRSAQTTSGDADSRQLVYFEKWGECGYVNQWNVGPSTRFTAFLVLNGKDNPELDPSATHKVAFVNTYDTLDSAKQIIEKECQNR